MACNWNRNTQDEIIGAVQDNGQPSVLFKQAQDLLGTEQAIEIYTASKSTDFMETFGLEEPALNQVLKFMSAKNAVQRTLTAEEKTDLRNVQMSVDFNPDLFYDENGLFIINESRLRAIYSPYELETIKGDIELQKRLKESVEALKNTEYSEETERFPSLEKTSEVNSFGKLQNLNPYIVQADILQQLGGLSEEDFEEKLIGIDYPNTLIDRISLIDNYARAEVMQEIDGVIVPKPIDDTQVLLGLKKVGEDTGTIADIQMLLAVDSDVLEQNMEDRDALLRSVEDRLLAQGLDVIGLSDKVIDKNFLSVLNRFLIAPTQENTQVFAQVYNEFFEKDTSTQEQPILAEKGRNYVYLETELGEEEIYEQQNLIKHSQGTYIKVNPKSAEELYAIVETYPEKYTGDLRQYVQEQTGNMDGFTSGDTAEIVILNKLYFDLPLITEQHETEQKPLELFTGNIAYLQNDFISDFYAEYLQEKKKDSKKWKSFYTHFYFDAKGIRIKDADPISLADIRDQASKNLLQYSLISKNMPSLVQTEPQEFYVDGQNRNIAVNYPEQVEPFEGDLYRVSENEFIAKNAPQEFIKIGKNVYENVGSERNLTIFARLPQADANFMVVAERPQTDINLQDYAYLQQDNADFTNYKKGKENESFKC